MKFLNFVRTESFVSLVEEEVDPIKPKIIPNYVFGVDKEGEYLKVDPTNTIQENQFVERRIEIKR